MRGVRYISWGDSTGYAVAAKSYLRGLAEAGIPLTWLPMLSGSSRYEVCTATDWPCPRLGAICNRQIAYDTTLIHTVPEYYPDWIRPEREAGARVFGYTVWELERLPDHWPAILNQLDGVLVPCAWNVSVFRGSGVTVPIHVVPHLSQFDGLPAPSAHDRAMFRQRLGSVAQLESRFVFYNIAFWSNRKAPYLALEAYLRAFTSKDPVLMIIKTSRNDITRSRRSWLNPLRRKHPSPRQTVAQMLANHPNPPPVVVIADEDLSDGEIQALHELGDCYVSLTRTEGWGLGAFEAARLGKPVVMTAYGGQLDFLDPDHSWHVGYRMVPVYEPTWPASYRADDQWAEPSVDEAAQHLREIFERPEESRRRAAPLASLVRDRFSREQIIGQFVDALAADRST